MTKSCLLIFNPISGGHGIEKEELVEMSQDNLPDYDFHFLETTGENDESKIQEAFDKHQPDLILIGGGDGTVKMVAMSLKTNQVPFGIVPLGSANGLAKCLGIHNLEDAWQAVHEFDVRAIDAIDINGDQCLHLADFGMNANLIRKFEEEEARGMFAYVKNSLSEIFTSEAKNFTLKLRGEEIKLLTKMVVIANGDQYGTGAKINCNGLMDDGKFEIISINPESAEDYVRMAMAFIKGDLDEVEGIQTWLAEECEVLNPDSAEFQIDGEVMERPKSVTAKILKHAFRFLVGKTFSACRISPS